MKICVFGAASSRIDEKYVAAVEKLGEEMAARGHELVFGAGGSGLMGAAARGVESGGGKIYGIIPDFFRNEHIETIYDRCTELIYTDTMRERKAKMEDLADAFIIVPGGIGTFEELFEVLTLKQLGRHSKPIAIYNIDGYYDSMETMMYHAMKERFVRSNCRMLYMYFTDTEEMFDYIETDSGTDLGVHQLKDG